MLSTRLVLNRSLLHSCLKPKHCDQSISGSVWSFGGNKIYQRSLRRLSHSSKKETEEEVAKVPLTFVQKWLAPKEIPPRGTAKWYGEMTLICTVFAIAGSSTMFLVRIFGQKYVNLS